jgi:hypothetical protein
VVVSATARAPPWASVMIAEKLTCSAPTMSARVPAGSPCRYTSCWSVPVVITPSGLLPGTKRAERGRSRQPVASTTTPGRMPARPPGPVSSSAPSAAHPVTIVSVSSSAPDARARSA